jgi:hypothetical protein
MASVWSMSPGWRTIAPRVSQGLAAMLRIIRGLDYCATADSPDEITHALRHAPPGRYVVEEVSRAGELLPSGHSCRRSGTAIRHPDGQVTVEPEPWRE